MENTKFMKPMNLPWTQVLQFQRMLSTIMISIKKINKKEKQEIATKT